MKTIITSLILIGFAYYLSVIKVLPLNVGAIFAISIFFLAFSNTTARLIASILILVFAADLPIFKYALIILIIINLLHTRTADRVFDDLVAYIQLLRFNKITDYKYLYQKEYFGEYVLAKQKRTTDTLTSLNLIAYRGVDFIAVIKQPYFKDKFGADVILLDETTLARIVDENILTKEELVALML